MEVEAEDERGRKRPLYSSTVIAGRWDEGDLWVCRDISPGSSSDSCCPERA